VLSAAKQRSRLRRRPEGRAKRVILHDPPMQKGRWRRLFAICDLYNCLMRYAYQAY